MANPEHVEIVKQGAEAIAAWREENPRSVLDLHNADLRSSNLAETDLTWANLTGANLVRADLKKANLLLARLLVADLTEANLEAANLASTDLTESDLSRSNLRHSSIVGTTFTWADVTDADFAGAECMNAVFGKVDLSRAKNLDSIIHLGPSTVGADALYLSGGKLPSSFLRGCGVAEHLITYLPSLLESESGIGFYSCFISYSHADKDFASKLHDALQEKGIRCWRDEHQMLPGDDIYEQVDRGIRHWDKVLLCASENSLTSWWVDNEIDSAFVKERELMRERGSKTLSLIPLNIDGYLLGDEWTSGKKQQIKSRLAGDFTGWQEDESKFNAAFEKLVRALNATEVAREQPPDSKL